MSYEPVDDTKFRSLDTDWFVDKYDEDHKCAICLEIPCIPVECPACGQIYCDECINKALTKIKACPKCQRRISTKDIKTSAFVGQKISGSKIKCKNIGCKEKFLVGKNGATAFDHYKRCQYMKVICDDCKVVMQFSAFNKHLDVDKKCPHRLITVIGKTAPLSELITNLMEDPIAIRELIVTCHNNGIALKAWKDACHPLWSAYTETDEYKKIWK
jgi:hypothetical protein